MDKELERYNIMVSKLEELHLESIGFTFDYYMENKPKVRNNIKILFKCSECGEEFLRSFSGIIRKDRNKVCLNCCKKKKLLPIKEVQKRIESKGLKLISEEYDGRDCQILVMCECGNIYETTFVSVDTSMGWEDGKVRCRECLKDRYKTEYLEIKKYFEDNGCKLISEEKEYLNSYSKLTFVAKCGHIHRTNFVVFKKSKHKLCKKCSEKVNSGENAYNWSGGYYDKEDTKFRHSLEYREWRKKVFERDEYTCKHCGCVDARLNAHHLDGYNWCEEGRIDVDNGITLCEDCHKEFHSVYGYKDNTIEQFKEFQSAQL